MHPHLLCLLPRLLSPPPAVAVPPPAVVVPPPVVIFLLQYTGVPGFDGVGEALVACPGPRAPGKTLGKITIANNNLALAA